MLQDQQYKDFEIVVVDNASKISEQSRLQDSLPSAVHFIKSDKNLGYSGGNNLGMRLKTNNSIDYFLILNNDIIIEDITLLYKLVQAFTIGSIKEIIAVSPIVNTVANKLSPEYQIQIRKLLNPYTMYLISFSLMKKIFFKQFNQFVYQSDAPYHNKYLFCDTINGSAFMVKANFMIENDFLDEGIFLFHEELVLGKQIQNAGGTCLLDGHVTIKHLQGISTGSNKSQLNVGMERYKYRSERYLYRKYYGMNVVVLGAFSAMKETEIFAKRLINQFK